MTRYSDILTLLVPLAAAVALICFVGVIADHAHRNRKPQPPTMRERIERLEAAQPTPPGDLP